MGSCTPMKQHISNNGEMRTGNMMDNRAVYSSGGSFEIRRAEGVDERVKRTQGEQN